MGEIEGLDTDEPLGPRADRHAFDRLIMLSDGVFAIAFTLAAIDLRPRQAWTDLPSLWRAFELSLFSYLLSFAVIAAYWISHRDLFARLRRVDVMLTFLTLTLLMGVAVLPATTRLLYEHGSPVAFQLYAASVAFVGFAQTALWAYAGFRPRLMLQDVSRAYRITRAATALLVPGFFTAVTVLSVRGLNVGQTLVAALVVGVVVLSRRLVLPWLERRTRR